LAKPIFPIAFLLVVVTFVMYLIKQQPFKIPQILLIVYFAFFFVLSYTPSHKIYYIINLNTVLNKEKRDTCYRAWDRYSWFLHLRGLKNEALEANKKAYQAVELQEPSERVAQKYFEIIKKHESLIEAENTDWNEWEAEGELY
jgi:hypothetical protein